MTKLWNKDGKAQLHPAVERYTAGDDPVLDNILLPYDIRASRAHARGLRSIGILTDAECARLEEALDAAEREARDGTLLVRTEDEDCHTVLENRLVALAGDAGKKIHTGRSRNDQVLVALRLCMRDHIDALLRDLLALARMFLTYAERYRDVPLPGYTHTQQAMLSSVGHYACACAESLLDDADFLLAVRHHINRSPLGSAAGFGVAFPLERERTAAELGFDGVQVNALACQNSRGKYESIYLEALVQVMLTLARFAADMLLFTSQEFGFFAVDDALVTGSSIMPQKRNLDGLEILRGNASVVMAHQHLAQDLCKGLISGYHRDLQLIKKAVLESGRIVRDSVEIAGLYLHGLTPKEESITAHISRGIFAADVANELVRKHGIPFREAYGQAQEHLDHFPMDCRENIRSKKSLGSPGNLGMDLLRKRLAELERRRTP